MRNYLLKRFLQFFFLLAAVSTVVFFLVHLVPGEPVTAILGERAADIDVKQVSRELNLDKPIFHRFFNYVTHLLHLDLGNSFQDRRPVLGIILEYLPYTFFLMVAAMLFALAVSLPLGAWAAFKGEEKPGMEAVVTLIGTVGVAVPSFFLGPLLILVFSVQLGWLPVSGSENVTSVVLPALTLGITVCAFLIRIVNTSIGIELKKPYVLLARAKGLTEPEIYRRHVLKNAMVPIITAVGLQMGALLGGTVITETIFSWPGIGSLLATAVSQRDYPMIQGIVLFITFGYLLINLLVDLSYFFIAPGTVNEFQHEI
jgi:peptide/nickel transport system permease protein